MNVNINAFKKLERHYGTETLIQLERSIAKIYVIKAYPGFLQLNKNIYKKYCIKLSHFKKNRYHDFSVCY